MSDAWKSRWKSPVTTHVLAGLICFALGLMTANMNRVKEPPLTDDPLDDRWRRFSAVYGSKFSRLKEIRLDIPKMTEQGGLFDLEKVSLSTSDPDELSAVTRSSLDAVRMVASPVTTIAGDTRAWGRLELRMVDGTAATCEMTQLGFTIDGSEPDGRNVFWSYRLADVVATLYQRGANTPLWNTYVERLAGITRPPNP